MEFKDLEEKLYNLYCSSEFENIISIARREFLKGNRELFIWTFLASAYCPSKFHSTNRKRGYFLSKIALNLVNKKLKKERTENLVFYCAILNINLRNYDKITKYCNELIKMNQNNYYSCGVLYNLSWNREKAFNCFKESAELTQYAHYYYNRGYTKYSLNNFQEAIEDYTKAIELKSDNERYYYWRAIAKNCLKDTQGALEDVNEAIELNSGVADFYEHRGVTNYYLKNYKEAIEDDTKAIQLNPFVAQVYFNRGTTKFHLKDYQESIKDITKAIELRPQVAAYYYKRSDNNYKLGNKAAAILDLTCAIQLDNTFTNAYLAKSKLVFKDNSKEALKILLAGLKNCKPMAHLFTGLSFVYFSQKDYKLALKYADEAILFNKDNGTGYYRKYCALVALGKQNEAREFLEKANSLGYEETF